MKKIYFALIAVLLALTFTGCQADIDHPIAGHTYSNYGGSSIGSISVYVTFHSKGSFEIDYMTKTYTGYEHNKYGHMKWSVEGNRITVIHDNSTYWKSSVRGTEAYSGSYNPSNNTVTLDGTTYEYSY